METKKIQNNIKLINPYLLNIRENERFKINTNINTVEISDSVSIIEKTLTERRISTSGGYIRFSDELIKLLISIDNLIILQLILKICNIVKFNRDTIELDKTILNCSKTTFYRLIDILKIHNVITRKTNNTYWVNPFMLYKGDILKLYNKYKKTKQC